MFTVSFQRLLWYVHVEKTCRFSRNVSYDCVISIYLFDDCHSKRIVRIAHFTSAAKLFFRSWNLPYDLIYMKPMKRRGYWKAKYCCWFPRVSRTWLHVTSMPIFHTTNIRPHKVKSMFLVLLPGQFFQSHFFRFAIIFINKVTRFIIENCVATAVLKLSYMHGSNFKFFEVVNRKSALALLDSKLKL